MRTSTILSMLPTLAVYIAVYTIAASVPARGGQRQVVVVDVNGDSTNLSPSGEILLAQSLNASHLANRVAIVAAGGGITTTEVAQVIDADGDASRAALVADDVSVHRVPTSERSEAPYDDSRASFETTSSRGDRRGRDEARHVSDTELLSPLEAPPKLARVAPSAPDALLITMQAVTPIILPNLSLPTQRSNAAIGLGQVSGVVSSEEQASIEQEPQPGVVRALATPIPLSADAAPSLAETGRKNRMGGSLYSGCMTFLRVLVAILGWSVGDTITKRWSSTISIVMSNRSVVDARPSLLVNRPSKRLNVGPASRLEKCRTVYFGGRETAGADWSSRLYMLSEDGDPHQYDDWREVQLRIGRTGELHYSKEDSNEQLCLFDGVAVQNLVVEQLPSHRTCYPHSMSIVKPPSENPQKDLNPTYFAAQNEMTLVTFLRAISEHGSLAVSDNP